MIQGAPATSKGISPPKPPVQVRRTVHRDRSMETRELEGEVNKAYYVSDLTFRFAHISQRIEGAPCFDTSRISRSVGNGGVWILGGATTLGLLTTHIDYRDGLVKFDYGTLRGDTFRGSTVQPIRRRQRGPVTPLAL